MQWGRFFRDRFDLIFVTCGFMTMFIFWVHFDFSPKIETYVAGLFGALLATVNASLKRSSGGNIDTASTVSGDIINKPDGEDKKET